MMSDLIYCVKCGYEIPLEEHEFLDDEPDKWHHVNPHTCIQNLAKEIHEICHEIGCSHLDPTMCNERPWMCEIIRKVMRFCSERGA